MQQVLFVTKRQNNQECEWILATVVTHDIKMLIFLVIQIMMGCQYEGFVNQESELDENTVIVLQISIHQHIKGQNRQRLAVD